MSKARWDTLAKVRWASHRWIVLGTITVLGAALIVTGALISDRSYASSVLSNLGTTVFLAIPLLLVERVLEQRLAQAQEETDRTLGDLADHIGRVQQSVADVSEQLAQVSRETTRRIDERRARDEADLLAPARAIAEEPSFATVMDAVMAAERAKAIARWRTRGGSAAHVSMSFRDRGFTVRVSRWAPTTYLGRRFPEQLLVSVAPSDRSLPWVPTVWKPEWSVEECFAEIDRQLRNELGSGAPQVPPDVVLARLVWALELALRRRTAGGATTRWALIGVVTDNWLVSTAGLEHVRHGVLVGTEDLRRGAEPPDMPEDLPDRAELPHAWSEAQRFLAMGNAFLDSG